MKRKQITAILLSAIMTVSVCLPAGGISAFAAENADVGTTETVVTETEAETETESGVEMEAEVETDVEAPDNGESLDEAASETDIAAENENEETTVREDETVNQEEPAQDIEAITEAEKDDSLEMPEEPEEKPVQIPDEPEGEYEKASDQETDRDGIELEEEVNEESVHEEIDEEPVKEEGAEAQKEAGVIITIDAGDGYFYDYDQGNIHTIDINVTDGSTIDLRNRISFDDVKVDYGGGRYFKHLFEGLYEDEDFTQKVDLDSYTVTGSKTLYIKYKPYYVVTLHGNEGYFEGRYGDTYESVKEDTIQLIIIPGVGAMQYIGEDYISGYFGYNQRQYKEPGIFLVNENGKTFNGWYYDTDCKEYAGYFPEIINYPDMSINNDLELYAGYIDVSSGVCGKEVEWKLNGEENNLTLVVSGKGAMNDYDDINAPWKVKANQITEIVIEPGVTTIGNSSFIGCENLEKITIPEGITSIGTCAFESCKKLESIDIPESVERINGWAFYNCGSLESIELPEGIIYLGYKAFSHCQSIKEISIPTKLQIIEPETFYGCSSLEKVTIHDGVSTIEGSAFDNCEKLRYLSIPKSLTGIESNAFYKCFSLENVTYEGTVDEWNSVSISNGNDVLHEIRIHCSDGDVVVKNENEDETDHDDDLYGLTEDYVTVSSGSYTYDGKEKKPTVVVKIGDLHLVEGEDYELKYSNNVNAGTAIIKVTGINGYTGTITKTFTIQKANQTIKANTAVITIPVGGTAALSVTGAQGNTTFMSAKKGTAAITGKTVKGISVGTTTVTAKAAGNSNYNAGTTTIKINVVPAATTKVAAENQNSGIKLTWAAVAGATGYDIYRNGSKLTTVTGGATVSYADKKATANGKAYTYKVVAKAATGISPLSKSVMTYCVTRPKISSVKNTESEKATAKWKKNAKATGYELQYCLKKNFKSGVKKATIKKKATVSRVLKSLKKKKTYYVRIRTYKTVGGKKYYSAWSAVKKVKIKN